MSLIEVSSHKDVFVPINTVPTQIVTYGKWIDDNLSGVKTLILFIPGNPGSVDMYKEFLQCLHNRSCLPVWGICHAGHVKPPISSEGENCASTLTLKGNENLYNLEGQIEHKISFIISYIPEDVEIILIGHSIGAKICMEVMKRLGNKYNFGRSYLLFPVIERMRETLWGRLLLWFRCIIALSLYLLLVIPGWVKTILSHIVAFYYKTPSTTKKAIRDIMDYDILNMSLYMAYDELKTVNKLDSEVIKEYEDKLVLYYGSRDHWTPQKFYRDFRKSYPNVKAVMCKKKFSHGFVLNDSLPLAEIVANWISGREIL